MLDRDGVIRDVVAVGRSGKRGARTLARPSLGRDRAAGARRARRRRRSSATRKSGESLRFRVQQLLPSGRELPVEYTTVSLGKNAGFVAIGRNLQNVSDLQNRLVDALKAREQDFWRLREIERRYRAVLDATERSRGAGARLEQARRRGQRPAPRARWGCCPARNSCPISPRATARRSRPRWSSPDPGARAEYRPAPARTPRNGACAPRWSPAIPTPSICCRCRRSSAAPETDAEADSLEQILRRLPDAFVLVDRDGAILKANSTFLDLAQVGVESAALGQKSEPLAVPSRRGFCGHRGPHPASRQRADDALPARRGARRGDPVEISAVGDRRRIPRRSVC